LSQVLSNASQSQSASNQTQATTPQLFLAAAAAAAAGAQPAGAISSTVPVQHILIPVSTNGVQQLLSVPLSLTSAGQTANTAIGQMQLVTTPNGQFLSTNVGPSPVNIAMPSTSDYRFLNSIIYVNYLLRCSKISCDVCIIQNRVKLTDFW
jgi:hypothetical protein